MSEEWRAVPGFEGEYEVSNLGRVRSLDRIVMCAGPRGGDAYPSRKKGRILRPGRARSGHSTVVLGRDAGSHSVHVIVLLAFQGECPPGREVRHKDGDPANNDLDNLEYATRRRNTQDKKWHNGASTYRLRPPDVVDILRRLARGQRGIGAELATEYGVAQSTISAIKHGKFHDDIRASY